MDLSFSFQVSWIRGSDLKILSIGKWIYIKSFSNKKFEFLSLKWDFQKWLWNTFYGVLFSLTSNGWIKGHKQEGHDYNFCDSSITL